MKYLSTRGGEAVSAAQAIVRGICPTGGLYVPASFPKLDIATLIPLADDYCAIAERVMALYLPEMKKEKMAGNIKAAYASFDTAEVVPLHDLTEQESVLELWHGPTMAFKDIALQMLPYLMRDSLDKTGESRDVYILVATSGDTGKAALAGFCDVPGTRVLVFYPEGGVSEAQRLQMVTQRGKNVDVCAVRGNFDDAQTGVKQIFASQAAATRLEELGYRLSSANSINFGRLLPQIVYYFSSYAKLAAKKQISCGERINFCVPTGNFGDILAGYYAMRMGLPINKLICASNRNNVLADFFRTGVYNDNRPFFKSMSCSIDILVSSNLERLLFEISGRDPEQVGEWMTQLRTSGEYSIGEDAVAQLSKEFYADWCTEEDTLDTIRKVWRQNRYLMDPHTAVAQIVYERYVAKTGDTAKTVLLSTANPYKFATHVLSALEVAAPDDFANVARLHDLTGASVPAGISELSSLTERHLDVCELDDMQSRVISGVQK